jgi:hypothetical protein
MAPETKQRSCKLSITLHILMAPHLSHNSVTPSETVPAEFAELMLS